MNLYIFYILLILNLIFAEAFDGLTLITNMGNGQNGSSSYLIDNEENIINSWTHETGSASVGYLSRDSILFLPSNPSDNGGNGAASGGLFQKIDWNGNALWQWQLPTEICIAHHDIEILPNQNILAICRESKTLEETINVGLEDAAVPLSLDMIVEIQPLDDNQANIVWKWHFWDHLVQDRNPNYTATYGEISDHPELLDINVNGNWRINDWNHTNMISYNEDFDQIVISSRHMNEIYVIDHSTTTEEAATNSGGNQGKGGDFIYRWGNPNNYDRGTEEDRIFGGQHGIHWIPNSYPGGRNFLVYNNLHQTNPNRSAVLEFENIADENGFYRIEAGEPFGPSTYDWIYQTNFYTPTQSGAYRLPNGNTLVTATTEFDFFEIDSMGRIQWNPTLNAQSARVLKYSYGYFENNLLLGDINLDGGLNILDIISMTELILNNETNPMADVNNDYFINILDILILVNLILGLSN
jgi:hypothetical protein